MTQSLPMRGTPATLLDLDPDLEAAGIEHLTKRGRKSK